jgi:hypothetical protein
MRASAGIAGVVRLFAGKAGKGVRPLFFGLIVACAGCAPTVDLSKGLEVQVVSSGWYDAGIVNGQNKLVPELTCQLKNVSDQKLVALQVNAIFRRVTEKDEWGATLVTAAGSEGLPAGQVSKTLTIRSPRGYTGSDQSREEMLNNSHFIDAKVELFAKYGSAQWKRIGEYPITRTLIAK